MLFSMGNRRRANQISVPVICTEAHNFKVVHKHGSKCEFSAASFFEKSLGGTQTSGVKDLDFFFTLNIIYVI
jgi:hypothetical protein